MTVGGGRRRDRRRLGVAAAASMVIVLGAVVVAFVAHVGAPPAAVDPEAAAVQALAADTLELEHRGPLPDPSARTSLSAADIDALHASAIAAAKAHYAGPLLATRTEEMLAAIDDAVDGTSGDLDGGVKDIVFRDTTIGRDAATVVVQATSWARGSQNGVIVNPVGEDTWTFTFAKIDGRWFVTKDTSTFHG